MDHYPVNTNCWKKIILIQKPCKILGTLWKFHFLRIPDTPTTNKRICRVHNVLPPPTPPPPHPSPLRLILIIFLQKWVCNVVLQKCAVEISQVRSAILKKCAGGIFRSAHQYLRSGYWSFYLEGLSDKSEVCTDRYQRSVDFWKLRPDLWKVHADNDIWEVHTGLSEVRTDVQKGRSGV